MIGLELLMELFVFIDLDLRKTVKLATMDARLKGSPSSVLNYESVKIYYKFQREREKS